MTTDRKLEAIGNGLYAHQDFIIADAKDPDMAFAIACTGPHANGG